MTQNNIPPLPASQPTVAQKKKNIPAIIASAVAVLFLVLFLVTAVGASNKAAPDSCVEALELADKGFGYSSDAFNAISEMDSSGLRRSTEDLKSIVKPYNEAKEECRGTE